MFIGKKVLSYQLFVGVIVGLSVSLFLTVTLQNRGSIDVPVSLPNVVVPQPSAIIESSPGNEVAAELEKEVRVLCWVMTNPSNHKPRTIHVKRTWGRRCNRLLLISSVQDDLIGTVGLPNVSEGRDWLWAKTKGAFQYIWEHHRDEADWFLKADDDTFVVVENLRKFLHTQSPAEPVYFGCHFSVKEIPSWPSGGAGYVLSKEALRRFIEVSLPNPDKCRSDHDGAEDAEMAKCLMRAGVHLGDSRDSLGRHRFLAFTPTDHVYPHEKALDYWYWKDLMYPQEQGLDCCATDAITFHYVSPRDMYAMEYFLYHLRPYGINKEVRYVQEYPLELTEPPPTTTTAPVTTPVPIKPNTTTFTSKENITNNVIT
ncbi:unnamed protein product [Allacma fusca]|uniref:Glycoprotein-N-acetylgalactosamine 3-beta-galactosyltransferase 1 n=1 Tax=Allacma fusca TaxID=39272 RepID=A0A8J2LED5_9HEXA|nr:unnamed protein product [Allacma fusca]